MNHHKKATPRLRYVGLPHLLHALSNGQPFHSTRLCLLRIRLNHNKSRRWGCQRQLQGQWTENRYRNLPQHDSRKHSTKTKHRNFNTAIHSGNIATYTTRWKEMQDLPHTHTIQPREMKVSASATREQRRYQRTHKTPNEAKYRSNRTAAMRS